MYSQTTKLVFISCVCEAHVAGMIPERPHVPALSSNAGQKDAGWRKRFVPRFSLSYGADNTACRFQPPNVVDGAGHYGWCPARIPPTLYRRGIQHLLFTIFMLSPVGNRVVEAAVLLQDGLFLLQDQSLRAQH